jgi:hypothetical protein
MKAISCRIAVVLLVLSGWAGGVEFREVVWGFNGKVVARHFNLLSVLVDNPGDAPIEGVVKLQEGDYYQHGAVMVHSCYLAPHSSRWLQFYPWIEDRADEYKVSWVRSSAAHDIPAPEFTAPAVVRFDDGSRLTRSGGALLNFAEELFPSQACATTGLGAAVLDHAPRLQEAQCRALQDWLSSGGIVIVARGLDGHLPHFGPELDVLNATEPRHRVGSGWVLQLEAEGATAKEAIDAAGIAMARLTKEDANTDTFTQALLGHFAQIVRPRHSWTIIFLLLSVYLLLIGPIALVAARRKLDFRMVTASYLLAIAAFSGAIWHMGKRGYGEEDQLNSIGYAQALGHGAFAVTSWNNLFVTASGDYAVAPTAGAGVFACPGGEALTKDAVSYDQDGMLQVSIPMFSSRSFVAGSRRVVPGLEPRVAASAWDAQTLKELVVEIPGKTPTGEPWKSAVLDMRASYAGRLYELGGAPDGTFDLKRGGSLNEGEYKTQLAQALNQVHYSPQFRGEDDTADSRTMLKQAIHDSLLPMIAYGLGGQGLGRNSLVQPAVPGRAAVFVLIDQAQELGTSAHTATHGGMVYRFDLTLAPRSSP